MTTLLLAAVGAASEHEPLTAAALKARASVGVGADVDGIASADGSVDASVSMAVDHGFMPLRPAPERQPPPPPSNETNETEPQPPSEETAAPAPAPVANETADAPAAFDPHEQSMRGQAGAPLRFVVLLTNTAKNAQNVTLTVKAPVSWGVRLSPDSALLGPDETVPIHGTITTPALVGTSGTVAIFARGDGGEDVAYVNLCSIGVLQMGCRPGAEDPTPEPTPPADQTHEDPAAAPEPERTPPANETQAPPPPAEEEAEPAQPPAPAPESSSNSTASPSSNSTASGSGSSGASGETGADAEAWVSIEARASSDEEDDESPPPVTLDV